MTETEARKILGKTITPFGDLEDGDNYVSWGASKTFKSKRSNEVCLDGHFTAKRLEAIVWWMRNAPLRERNLKSTPP